jgi:hypothetical protein
MACEARGDKGASGVACCGGGEHEPGAECAAAQAVLVTAAAQAILVTFVVQTSDHFADGCVKLSRACGNAVRQRTACWQIGYRQCRTVIYKS